MATISSNNALRYLWVNWGPWFWEEQKTFPKTNHGLLALDNSFAFLFFINFNQVPSVYFFIASRSKKTLIKGHPFSTYAIVSNNLAFLTPCYAQVHVRNKWVRTTIFFQKHLRTFWIDDTYGPPDSPNSHEFHDSRNYAAASSQKRECRIL